jgi:hypothetical protein
MALKPVPNNRGGGPRAVASGAAASAAQPTGSVAAVGVTSAKMGRPSLREKRERILLMADPNAGKSYVYMRMAAIEYAKESNWADEGDTRKYTGPRFWVFDFDDTAPTFMEDGEEFDYLYFERGGNVYPFPCDDWEMTVMGFNYMRSYWRRGDYIVFDVINRLYEMSQELIAGVSGVNIDEQTVARIMRGRGFGAFEPNQWNAVARSFLSVYKRCEDSPCHILALSHMTEIVRARDKRTILSQFDQLGMRPQAPKQAIQDANTIIALWVMRDIEDKRKANSSATTVRYMTVLKDRGKPCYYTKPYDFDMYEQLKRERLNPANKGINITDPNEVARIEANVAAMMDARAEAEEVEQKAIGVTARDETDDSDD